MRFWGELTVNPFSIVLSGQPGSRKSSLVIKFCHYLASELNKRILYVCTEEQKDGKTMQVKYELMNSYHENIILTEKMPSKFDGFDFVVIDSVDQLGYSAKQLKEIEKEARKKGVNFIYIHQATKDGDVKGALAYQHLGDIVTIMDDGIARHKKNRYGGKGIMMIGEPENLNVIKVSTMLQAERYRDKQKEKHLIFRGDDTRYWVVSENKAVLLREKGYYCLDDIKLKNTKST